MEDLNSSGVRVLYSKLGLKNKPESMADQIRVIVNVPDNGIRNSDTKIKLDAKRLLGSAGGSMKDIVKK